LERYNLSEIVQTITLKHDNDSGLNN